MKTSVHDFIVFEKLRGRQDMWRECLPGLHLEFSDSICKFIFYGMSLEMRSSDVDPNRIYASVYAHAFNQLVEHFTNLSHSYYGSIMDCELMATKIAQKCVRNDLFCYLVGFEGLSGWVSTHSF